MAKKYTEIKTCRYRECSHKSKSININTDKYVKSGSLYYHEDCFKAKQQKDAELRDSRMATRKQTQKEKDDLLHIIDLWGTHIDKQANFGLLRKILNEYVDRGVSSERLVFTLEYVISHDMKLRYPFGFKYYVDDKKIIDAYYKTLYKQKIKYKTPTKKNRKNKTQEAQQNEAVKLNEDNAPTFTFNPPSIGFSSILKRK